MLRPMLGMSIPMSTHSPAFLYFSLDIGQGLEYILRSKSFRYFATAGQNLQYGTYVSTAFLETEEF